MAGLNGFKAKVQWGKKFDAKKGRVFKKLVSAEIAVTDYLPPASWTIVKFDIAPADAEQTRRIIFTPSFDGVHLPGQRRTPRLHEPVAVG